MEESSYGKDIAVDARLADGSYGGKDVEGYEIDPELSNRLRTVYYNKDGDAVVSLRGTELKDKRWWDELGTNALIATGLQDYSSRIKNDINTTNKAKEKYKNVRVVGHSQGGSRAVAVGHKTGTQGVAFDPAFSPVDLFRNRTYTNTKAYRTVNDLVSGLAPSIRSLSTTSIKAKKRNAHSLKNFL